MHVRITLYAKLNFGATLAKDHQVIGIFQTKSHKSWFCLNNILLVISQVY